MFEFELGMGHVDPECDMSNRHVSHGRPVDVAQSAYTPSQIEWNFNDLFMVLLSPDLSTVRHFLLNQTQLKCVMFGLKHTTSLGDLKDTKDVIDTVKVLKCYSGIATFFAHFSKSVVNTYITCAVWVESVVDAGVRVVEVCQLCV